MNYLGKLSLVTVEVSEPMQKLISVKCEMDIEQHVPELV